MKTHCYLCDIEKICSWDHLTVDEIFELLKEKHPKVGRSTVYRNVEEMSKKWILTKLTWVWEKTRYELTKWNHIHLIDLETWKIIDLDIDLLNLPGVPSNFKTDFSDIKLYWNFIK